MLVTFDPADPTTALTNERGPDWLMKGERTALANLAFLLSGALCGSGFPQRASEDRSAARQRRCPAPARRSKNLEQPRQ